MSKLGDHARAVLGRTSSTYVDPTLAHLDLYADDLWVIVVSWGSRRPVAHAPDPNNPSAPYCGAAFPGASTRLPAAAAAGCCRPCRRCRWPPQALDRAADIRRKELP